MGDGCRHSQRRRRRYVQVVRLGTDACEEERARIGHGGRVPGALHRRNCQEQRERRGEEGRAGEQGWPEGHAHVQGWHGRRLPGRRRRAQDEGPPWWLRLSPNERPQGPRCRLTVEPTSTPHFTAARPSTRLQNWTVLLLKEIHQLGLRGSA